MERRPLPLPEAMDALKAVLDERFDAINERFDQNSRRFDTFTARFDQNTREFESLHRSGSDALAAIANVKSEVLQDRAETALLTSQVKTQNGNVAEAMRRIVVLEKERDTEAIEKRTIDHVKSLGFEAVKFASGGTAIYLLHLIHVIK